MARREHGKLAVLELKDTTGQLQLFAKLDALGDGRSGPIDIDIGDFVGAEGRAQDAARRALAAPHLLAVPRQGAAALPEKYHGLKDIETRYRRRYLDTMVNAE